MTEEQEQTRLTELRDLAERDVGAVSLLSYEMACASKTQFAKRLRAALLALHEIEMRPESAREIAVAAQAADTQVHLGSDRQ